MAKTPSPVAPSAALSAPRFERIVPSTKHTVAGVRRKLAQRHNMLYALTKREG